MPILTLDRPSAAPYQKRMIHCPGHWMVPPQVDVYLREPVPWYKELHGDKVEVKGKVIKLRKTRIVKDRWGNKMLDWKKLYQLRDQGIVKSPSVSAAWAIEHVYDPISMLCRRCPKYCKEGQGKIVTTTIRRLNQ